MPPTLSVRPSGLATVSSKILTLNGPWFVLYFPHSPPGAFVASPSLVAPFVAPQSRPRRALWLAGPRPRRSFRRSSVQALRPFGLRGPALLAGQSTRCRGLWRAGTPGRRAPLARGRPSPALRSQRHAPLGASLPWVFSLRL